MSANHSLRCIVNREILRDHLRALTKQTDRRAVKQLRVAVTSGDYCLMLSLPDFPNVPQIRFDEVQIDHHGSFCMDLDLLRKIFELDPCETLTLRVEVDLIICGSDSRYTLITSDPGESFLIQRRAPSARPDLGSIKNYAARFIDLVNAIDSATDPKHAQRAIDAHLALPGKRNAYRRAAARALTTDRDAIKLMSKIMSPGDLLTWLDGFDVPVDEQLRTDLARKTPTSSQPTQPDSSLTPALRQYLTFKRQYPDYILLFRMGDFYEMFWDDAKIAARVLNITLTTRDKNGANPVQMAGVPFHAVESYLARLIRAGHRVAIAEQIEDPKTSTGPVVKREVTRLVSGDSSQTPQPDSTRLTNVQIEKAVRVAKLDAEVSIKPERTAVTASGRMYSETAWQKPERESALPWSPPSEKPIALVDRHGNVTYTSEVSTPANSPSSAAATPRQSPARARRAPKRQASASTWAWRHRFYAFRNARRIIQSGKGIERLPELVNGEHADYVRRRLGELARSNPSVVDTLTRAGVQIDR